MNELVKVYGHRRSGNNLLCSLLYYNFFPDVNLRSKDDPIPTKFCTLPDGSKEKYSPWGGLFGSHDISPSSLSVGQLERAIYISRNAKDTAESYISFMQSIGKMWGSPPLLMEKIIAHHNVWSTHPYSIYYRDLIADPVMILKHISKWFDLERVPDEWWIPDRKVGWNPRD